MKTSIRRFLAAAFFLPGLVMSALAANTTIRRVETPVERPAMGNDHWTSDHSDRRGGGIERRNSSRQNYPTAPDGGSSYRERRSGTSVDVGRTRIIRQSGAGPAPEGHAAIARNTTIIRNVQRNERTEITPDRDYWHRSNGERWVHRYRGGNHWYGFYHDSDFYWTRYHGNRWWWYDSGFGHWVYWTDGGWCWPAPGGVTYIYVNNGYVPSDRSVPPAMEESSAGDYPSPDGTRLVQIHGSQSQAFLYDRSANQSVFLAYLGKNVEKVRFSKGGSAKPDQLLVDFKDGTFSLFTSDGDPLDTDPPPTPADIPDLPDEN